MTFFLNGPDTPPKIKANNPDVDLNDLTFWGAGVPAATSSASLTNDANFRARREGVKARTSVGWDIAGKIGSEAVMARAREAGIPEGQINLIPTMMERRSSHMSPELSSVLFDLGNEAKKASPDDWTDIETSQDAVDERANAAMQKEYQDAQQILDMMPGGRGMADFIGGMVGITADIKNLPFLVMGGGSGSLVRIMGREATINMAAEGATMSSQYQMAKRLNIPDPDVAAQLIMAAAGGAAFAGLLTGAQRGLSYWKIRDTTPKIAGYDDLQSKSMVDQAEDILTDGGPDPLGRVQQIMQDTPPAPKYADVNPINPERPPLILRSEDRITTTPLEPVDGGVPAPLTKDQIIENSQKAIDQAETQDGRSVKPLVSYLRDNHKVTKKQIANAEKSGGPMPTSKANLQIHPDGWMAQELKARGITAKNAPGLFSKAGRKDFDNLVASEMDEAFPGIIDATGTKYGDNYLDRDGFLDVLARDIEGDSTWLRSREDAARMQDELSAFEGRTAEDDFLDYEVPSTPDRGYINPNEKDFANSAMEYMDSVDLRVRSWMDEHGFGGLLTDVEKREIISELQTNGGNTEYLVERAIDREVDYVESPTEDIPFGENNGSFRQSNVGTDPFAPEAGGSSARQTDGGNTARLSERTDAGEQSLIDGVAPITERQRLEAAQGAPMRGGNAAADSGLFDINARTQMDIFSDPVSPEARVVQDSLMDDLRTDIGKGNDFKADMGDGKGEQTGNQILDDLDADDGFLARISLCGKGSI